MFREPLCGWYRHRALDRGIGIMSCVGQIELDGLLQVAEVLGSLFQKALEQDLENLKRLLELQAAHFSDPRAERNFLNDVLSPELRGS